jgi:hypothetical protein
VPLKPKIRTKSKMPNPCKVPKISNSIHPIPYFWTTSSLSWVFSGWRIEKLFPRNLVAKDKCHSSRKEISSPELLKITRLVFGVSLLYQYFAKFQISRRAISKKTGDEFSELFPGIFCPEIPPKPFQNTVKKAEPVFLP